MRIVSLPEETEIAKFAKRAAEAFKGARGMVSFTDGDIAPGKRLALRWNEWTVAVMRLADTCDGDEPRLYDTGALGVERLSPVKERPADWSPTQAMHDARRAIEAYAFEHNEQRSGYAEDTCRECGTRRVQPHSAETCSIGSLLWRLSQAITDVEDQRDDLDALRGADRASVRPCEPGATLDTCAVHERACAFAAVLKGNRRLAERAKALETPVCIGEPTIRRLAKDGAATFENGQSLIAASDLLGADPYNPLTRRCYLTTRGDACETHQGREECALLALLRRLQKHTCTASQIPIDPGSTSAQVVGQALRYRHLAACQRRARAEEERDKASGPRREVLRARAEEAGAEEREVTEAVTWLEKATGIRVYA